MKVKDKNLLFILNQKSSDEIFSFLRNIPKGFLIKVPVTGFDIPERFDVIISSEGRQTTQPKSVYKKRKKIKGIF